MRFIKTFQEKKKSTTLHNVKYPKQEKSIQKLYALFLFGYDKKLRISTS